ncbi:hypothetical protein ACLKA7_016449 [Drosophila subpalustris]
MVIDIKMCRFDNVPWGFRLVGGADYEYPLTVVKVTEGSIAEEAGLCVGDVIVRINDTAATPLTHDEAHRLILSSGSVFYFGVHREREEEVCEGPRRFPVSSSTKSPGQSPLSTSELSLPSLTEATKALIPEEELQLEREQVEVKAESQSESGLECRRAVTEMHSVDGHSCSAGQQEEAVQQKEQKDVVPVDSLYLPDLPDRPCSAMSEQSEIKLVEEEIAAVLSGESEVLKEHNVLGVNFYRIFPKPGVCMTSDVLRNLNEEVTKTKQEKEKENRKWSTFLQRPDRPVPKSKQQLEAERRAANAYKVKIVKSAPRDKSPMPETKPAPKEATPPPTTAESKEEEEEEKEATVEEEEEEPLPTDSEVPNLLQLPDNGNGSQDLPGDADVEQLEKADASKEESPQEEAEVKAEGEGEGEEGAEGEGEGEVTVDPNGEATPPKTDEELALEKQLSDVQKQLAALSSLPSTIQSTLDAVTKQLAELLPTFKLQQQQQQQQQLPLPQIDEKDEKEGNETGQLATGENEDTDAGNSVAATDVDVAGERERKRAASCEHNEDKCDDANDLEVAEFSHPSGDNRQLELDEHLLEQQTFRKQKHNVRFQE